MKLPDRMRYIDSSNMTWAFVPLAPNELTPARRGTSAVTHGIGLVGMTTGQSENEMPGFSLWK